jgi:hypothetical protein
MKDAIHEKMGVRKPWFELLVMFKIAFESGILNT